MSIFVLKDFHELYPPSLDGALNTEWCAYDKDDAGMFYLLNKDRYQLCNLAFLTADEVDENLHFPSEVDCHVAASEYYMSHNKHYPYIHQWRAAIAAEKPLVTGNVQSQPMDFT